MARALDYRGIGYDTGTDYLPERHSREDWTPQGMRDDILLIRDGLHCNAVNVFGSYPDHIAACAEFAAECGLVVWVQPHPVDVVDAVAFDQIARVAETAESLRRRGADVRMNLGCEFSLFARGIVPGRSYTARARALYVLWPAMAVVNRRLDRYLAGAAAVARSRFTGELTYGAGSWEKVDWRIFDAVGVNLYRDSYNAAGFERTLDGLVGQGKPVLITEFGCCSYPGADRRGAGGDTVVDWRDLDAPRVKGDHPRDEEVQRRYIAELLDLFGAHGVSGAFVFEFSEPTYPRSDDPRRDIDVAGFGVLAAVPRVGGEAGRAYDLVPKAAFHEIARRYAGAGGSAPV